MIERFALADELTCYYDRPAEPANVHLEARVPGRLDPAAISTGVSAVLASQPRIMARRRQGSWQRRYYWEFPVPASADPVLITAYTGQEDLDRQRDAFLSTSPSLADAPPLRFMLASGAGGDHLILNAHHAAFDGLSCLRLMHEVAAAYRSEAGSGEARASRPPVLDAERAPAVEPVRSRRASAGRPDATRARIGKTARIAPGSDADRNRPGYGAHLVTWDEVAVTDSLRRAGFSVNDLLIAALMITISDWNQARGGGTGQIKITMPVGDKRQAGSRWSVGEPVKAHVRCSPGGRRRQARRRDRRRREPDQGGEGARRATARSRLAGPGGHAAAGHGQAHAAAVGTAGRGPVSL